MTEKKNTITLSGVVHQLAWLRQAMQETGEWNDHCHNYFSEVCYDMGIEEEDRLYVVGDIEALFKMYKDLKNNPEIVYVEVER